MPGYSPTTDNIHFVVNGVDVQAAWIRTFNLQVLLGIGALRVDNPVVNGVAGEIGEQPVLAATTYTLRSEISGEILHDGSAPSGVLAGIDANLAYFRSQIAIPAAASVTGTLTWKSGSTASPVQVTRFDVADQYGASWVRCEWDVRVLNGVFA